LKSLRSALQAAPVKGTPAPATQIDESRVAAGELRVIWAITIRKWVRSFTRPPRRCQNSGKIVAQTLLSAASRLISTLLSDAAAIVSPPRTGSPNFLDGSDLSQPPQNLCICYATIDASGQPTRSHPPPSSLDPQKWVRSFIHPPDSFQNSGKINESVTAP
jgi:hypothetical protein